MSVNMWLAIILTIATGIIGSVIILKLSHNRYRNYNHLNEVSSRLGVLIGLLKEQGWLMIRNDNNGIEVHRSGPLNDNVFFNLSNNNGMVIVKILYKTGTKTTGKLQWEFPESNDQEEIYNTIIEDIHENSKFGSELLVAGAAS